MKKTCPRCSAKFLCREDRTDLCQCTRVYLQSGVRDYIKENYENCLCQKCLKETNINFNSFSVNPKFLINRNIKKNL